jgi:putative ABC transport system substrate-binding protein
MNNRRKLLVALGAGAFATPRACFAAQPAKVARVGFLGPTSAGSAKSRIDALRAGLRELGYVEGKNLVIEFRWADDNDQLLPQLAAELVRLKVDVIVTQGTSGTRAAKQATSTIPIVMANSADAVMMGLVASLAHPGGNITGSTIFAPETSAKQFELLKGAVPRITQVAVLLNPANPNNGLNLQAMELTAESLKVGIQRFEARGPVDFDTAFSAMTKKRVDAVTISQDSMLIANARAIADVALKLRLPSSGSSEIAEAGGLIGYGVSFSEMFRRAAFFVDKILKGAKPGDIPVEQPTKFELVINMKTAKALGIKIPNAILVRADRVIE